MIAEILGIGQRRAGTGKVSKKPYDITVVYCAYPSIDVDGKKVEEITFNHLTGMKFPDISVGSSIFISHDSQGYLEEFYVVEKDGKAPQGGNLKITNS